MQASGDRFLASFATPRWADWRIVGQSLRIFGCIVWVGLALAPAVGAEPLRFGMLGNSFAWTWMSPQMFDHQRAVGVQDARIDVVWSDLQRANGPIDFRIADNRFGAVAGGIGQRSMRALPTIYVGRGSLTCNKPCEQLFSDGVCERQSNRCQTGCECCQRCPLDPSVSRVPLDLSDQPDADFAYSRTYYDFIRAFVERYREQLDYLVIENEADNRQFWDTANDPDNVLYVRLLATAQKAVQDTEPRIRVADSGLGSTLFGICIAKYRLDTEQRSAQEVLDFLRDYGASYANAVDKPALIPPLGSPDELAGFLAQFTGCGPLENLVAAGANDVWNFHYYEGDRTVQAIAEYFQTREALFGRPPRPLLTNELSCRPQKDGTPRDEARCLFRNLVATQALGVQLAAWYGVSGQPGVVVWDQAGDEQPAAQTYRLLANRLGGKVSPLPPPQRGPDIFRADFADAVTAVANVVALWSWDSAVHLLELPRPAGYTRGRVFDYLGSVRALTEPDADSLAVSVGNDPLLVVWEKVALPCVGDCSGDGEVTVDEIIAGVNLALGITPLGSCPSFDANGDNAVTIDELVRSVSAALEGCG